MGSVEGGSKAAAKAAAERAKERVYRLGLDWLDALAPGRRLLDIGAGFGHFLRLASDRGWEAHGLEADADAAMEAREAGLDVATRRIEDPELPFGTFSAVTFWDVLDHLPDPVANLRRASDLLDEGGIVLARVRNADFHFLVQRSLGRLPLPRTASPVLHRFGFGAKGLRAVFGRAGLERVALFNSPTTAGDPYAQASGGPSTYLIALIKALLNLTAGIAGRISGGRLLLASSLLAIGRKPTSRRTVLHIITRLDRGGSAENTYLSARGLVREGFQLLLLQGPDSVTREERVIPTLLIPRLVPAVSPLNDLPAFLHLYRLILRIRPTIVHTHTSKAGALGRAAARLAGVPVIVHTPHGHVFYGHFGRIKTTLFIVVERFLARFTDRIITLTARGAQEHIDFGIGPPGKFVPIASGIDLEEVQRRGEKPLLRETLGIPADALLVGSAGRLVPVKGYLYLVHAAAKLLRSRPETYFIIFGDGPERASLLREIERIGISKNFKIRPATDNLPAAIAAMDLFVLPSLNEGMGRVLLEAMALGKACTATRAGGIPDIVLDGRTGILVPSQDTDSLASSILYLLEHPEVRERMGNEGRRRVEEGGFSEAEMVGKIAALYREILAQKEIQ